MKNNVFSFIAIVLTLISPAFASQNLPTNLTSAANCQNLDCVRNNIDNIDKQIIILIGDRLAYVKRAGELKVHTASVHDQAREDKILHTVSQQAETAGYPAPIASAVFKTILAQSNVYEKHFHHEQK